ncbi:MAG: hypothetical protein M1826_004965 [Phylliscum demangeonii]|nr:MAG: hypothetical protein M1826_004965 [Phylliscum demangeonii]
MYTPTRMASVLLALFLAAQHVHGTPSIREPKTMFGYAIEEVPHALRSPFEVRTGDLQSLSAFGRLGNIFWQPEPIREVQDAIGHVPSLRLHYFAYEAEKRWQYTLIYRAMMEDSDFLECMAPCLNLPLSELLLKRNHANGLALFFCGTKCQETTGQDRGIAFPYINRWLPNFDENPAWHDLSQEHAPSAIIAPQIPQAIIAHPAPQAILRPHAALHRWARPGAQPLARLAHSLRSWERTVQKKMPALEREVVTGE